MNKWIAFATTGLAALVFTACERNEKPATEQAPAVPAASTQSQGQSPAGEPSTNQPALPAGVANESAPAGLNNAK